MTRELAWQLFKATGNTGYYSLYKRLSEDYHDGER